MIHGHGKMGKAPAFVAVTRERRRYLRVGAVFEVFFFFFFGFVLTRIGFTPTRLWFTPIRPELGRIGWIGSYRLAAKFGQNRSKSALLIMLEQPKFSLNKAQIKHPKFVIPQFYFEYLLLLLCFVFLSFFFLCFVNQGNIMCFLRIFW